MEVLRDLVRAVSHLVAPRVCRVCGCTLNGAEDTICISCLAAMPRANFHTSDFNTIHRRLGHQCKVDRGAGWFLYRSGNPYARLLIDAKYRNLPRQARVLGRMCAAELAADGFFNGIDFVVPMPMHRRKLMKRGYNQTEEICLGISDVTDIPVHDALVAVLPHKIQARRGREARFTNIRGTMALGDGHLVTGKSILLVDDILTTGATMAEAVRAVSEGAPGAVNVLCLGVTEEY